MVTVFLSTAKTFLYSLSSSSSLNRQPQIHCQKPNARQRLPLCKAIESDSSPNSKPPSLTKRNLSLSLTTTLLFSTAGQGYNSASNAAILEADDDVELLERVKKDRQKRIERQGVISSSNKEKAYLQDLVYKLSKVGQAIENNDLSAATSVLGQNTDADWVQKANLAFSKLSSSPEEKTEVETFNSSLASLISSVLRKDVDAAKIAFVSSATAFEKWTALTGLVGQLKGL